MDNPWADHHPTIPDDDDGGGDAHDQHDTADTADTTDDSWKSGFDPPPDIVALLALLLDPAPPPPLQFSTSATALAFNDALKRSRNLPASSASPLARFLTAKASVDWENAIRADHDVVVPDTPHVGWRVLDKDDSKQKRPPGGLLSFWNRRPETPSPEAVQPVPPRPASPPKQPPPPPSPAPSAVSRFLNRFSRAKGPHHTSLALSSGDLEFLSDIVPSATDPPDQVSLAATTPSPLPPKLPPPPTRPSSTVLDPVTVAQVTPPLSPKPPALVPHTPPLSLTHPSVTQQRPLPSPLLSLPPLLPPPPTSPPQTPRPGTFSIATPRASFAIPSTSFNDPGDSDDDEFSAFTSFPPSAPFPSERSPSPPSPPPRRTYERTHYPSSSSASSVQSPASQTSLDHLYSSNLALDSFDDLASPPRKRTPSPPPLPAKPQRQQPRVDTVFPSRVHHTYTQSQTFTSPTVHTSLMNSAPSPTSVSNAEHQRTQSLVNRAAARGGVLWPNSPKFHEPKLVAIPPPPSASASPKLTGQEGFDLLGGFDSFPAPLGADSNVAPFGMVDNPGKRLGLRHELQPTPPPLLPASAPILSFSSLGTRISTNRGPTQAAKMGGLSAQDISFFEGL